MFLDGAVDFVPLWLTSASVFFDTEKEAVVCFRRDSRDRGLTYNCSTANAALRSSLYLEASAQ